MNLDTLQWTSEQNPFLYLPFEEDEIIRKRKKRQLKYGGDRYVILKKQFAPKYFHDFFN